MSFRFSENILNLIAFRAVLTQFITMSVLRVFIILRDNKITVTTLSCYGEISRRRRVSRE